MKKIILISLLVFVCGCSIHALPDSISKAIDVQFKYTKIYVEQANTLLEDDETKQIGKELVKNAEVLSTWANGGK